MKKVFAVAMTLVMLVSVLTVSAGAVNPEYAQSGNEVEVTWDGAFTMENNTEHGGGRRENEGDDETTTIGTHDVTVNVKDSNNSGIVHVYAVTFDTSELTFTWNSSAQLVWNPDELKYDNTSTEEGAWVNGEGSGTSSTATQNITVYNYSDVAIKVEATTPVTSSDTGVTVSVNGPLALDSAYTGGQIGTVQSDTLAVTVTGKPTGTYATAQSIATITLTVTRTTPADTDTGTP